MAYNRFELLRQIIKERIVLIDGPKGSLIQTYNLTEEQFRGERFKNHKVSLKGNNEILNLTKPDLIYSIHIEHLKAGSDIIGTNTFNGTAISQEEYRTADIVYEINKKAAEICRKAADEMTKWTPEKPRFVSGTVGPTKKTLSLAANTADPAYREFTFDQIVDVYYEQMRGFVDGGADLFIIETIFDTLMAKAAIIAAQKIRRLTSKNIPFVISATISDASGRLLAGQTIDAFWNTIKHAEPLAVGFNCSLGADILLKYVRQLSKIAYYPIIVYPNAGLPNEFGDYDQTPEIMASMLEAYFQENLVNIVGGCCGSTPAHIEAISRIAIKYKPRPVLEKKHTSCYTGLESFYNTDDSLFINIGERTNVSGSRKFANLIKEKEYDKALEIAREQIENGAQLIDINMDDGLLDAKYEMTHFLNLLASDPDISRVPFVLDSSNWSVLEAGLKCTQGKCIVNSISLKDGEEKFIEKALFIKDIGAAVIIMAFDENGQADTVERKKEICLRSYKLLTEKIKFPPEDIIFDPNILAIGTGIKEHNHYAVDFIGAVKFVRENLPFAKVSGGISNLSFSFRGNESLRKAIHAVFLYHAIKAGMNMGIINPAQTITYNEISPDLLEQIEDLVLDRKSDATDRLLENASNLNFQAKENETKNVWRQATVQERIKYALLRGVSSHLNEDLDECLKIYSSPVEIIEGPLMDGMKEIGDLFGAGKMFLPQVVKSARIMKAAVSYLNPFILKANANEKAKTNGKIVIATVKGDVHDIGKNIVTVILQCNNYEIIDLGVMVPCEVILESARKHNADIIGLSGLITPSLEEMINVAQEMQRGGFTIPLILGGATTSETHTAIKIAPVYKNSVVVQVKDASKVIPVVNKLMKEEARGAFVNDTKTAQEKIRERILSQVSKSEYLSLREAREKRFRPDFSKYHPVKPSFLGVKELIDFPINELADYIDWEYFFKAWKIEGKFPDIFNDPQKGEAAKKLFSDANDLLQNMINKKLIKANGVIFFYPANSTSDDTIEIYTDESRNNVSTVIPMLRQQTKKKAIDYYLSLSDFIANKSDKIDDYIGGFAVTAGIGLSEVVEEFKKQQNDFMAILAQMLADRLAEAFAEKLHELVRTQYWGYAKEEHLTKEGVLKGKYTGIRPAPGYPPCPNHIDKKALFTLLEAEQRACIHLTESYMMVPAASVSGFYFAHPESKYFSVGKLQKDQIEDYARRSGVSKSVVEKWLSSNIFGRQLTMEQ